MLEVVSLSEAGRAHSYEDRVLVDQERGLFAIADGVSRSTQGTGAAAADLAVKLLSEYYSGDLRAAMAKVHEIAFAQKKGDWSIGETTLTAMAVSEPKAVICNVGDSPAYLVQGANITELYTTDRDLHGGLAQVIGYPEKVDVHASSLQLSTGDLILLASDGIEHILSPPQIYKCLSWNNANQIADSIVKAAKAMRMPADDDKSVIVIKVVAE